jgi:hypothetical protein
LGGGLGIDTDGKSFGFYANNANSAVGFRPFAHCEGHLAVGQKLKCAMDNGWIVNGAAVGLILRTGNARSSTADANTGARFEFKFVGGTSNYRIVDASGIRDTGVGFTDQGLNLEFTLTGANTYVFKITKLASGFTTNITGSLSGVTGSTLDSVAIYNQNAGSGAQYNAFFNSFQLTTDPGVDADSDGIPDWWTIRYFAHATGQANDMSRATDDPYGTGQNNFFKYVAGLVPTSPSSIFCLNIQLVSGQPTQRNLLFNPVVFGRTYAPQFSTNLTLGDWLPLAGYTGPQTNGNEVTITDTNAIEPSKFYRIRITYP